MAKLKVGNIVTILPNRGYQKSEQKPRWTTEMTYSVGQEHSITAIKVISTGETCAGIRLSQGTFWYRLEWLMLTEEYNKKIKTSKKDELDNKQRAYIREKLYKLADEHVSILKSNNRNRYKTLIGLSKKYKLKTRELKGTDLMKLISKHMTQMRIGHKPRRTLVLPSNFKVDEMILLPAKDLIPDYQQMLLDEITETTKQKVELIKKKDDIWNKADKLAELTMFGTKKEITKELAAFSKLKV